MISFSQESTGHLVEAAGPLQRMYQAQKFFEVLACFSASAFIMV